MNERFRNSHGTIRCVELNIDIQPSRCKDGTLVCDYYIGIAEDSHSGAIGIQCSYEKGDTPDKAASPAGMFRLDTEDNLINEARRFM